MTFLEICQRIAQESGYSSTGPSSVVSQTGDNLRFVIWAQDSDLEIQGLRTDWDFMREELSLSFASVNTASLPSDFNRVDQASIVGTRADGTKFYPDFVHPREMRLIKREQTDNGGIPIWVMFDNGSCEFFPTPTETVTLSADYFVNPIKMTANSDTPRIPEQYHMAIVFHALMSHGAYDEASNTWQHAHSKWTQYFNQMNMSQLPELKTGGALA